MQDKGYDKASFGSAEMWFYQVASGHEAQTAKLAKKIEVGDAVLVNRGYENPGTKEKYWQSMTGRVLSNSKFKGPGSR